MDVRCEKCLTEYEFDDAKVSEAGVTVKCTTCGFVFKVRRMVAAVPAVQRRADEFAPEAAAIDKAREWKIRQPHGNIFTCRELTTLQKWIVERKVSREDEISLTGDAWKRLGDIPELANFFLVVDQANRAALLEEQIKSGPNLQPTFVAPGRTSGNYQLGSQPTSSDPTWADPGKTRRSESFEEEDLRAIKKRGPGIWIALVVLIAAGGTGAYFYLHGQAPAPVATIAPVAPPVPAPVIPTPSTTGVASVPVPVPASGSVGSGSGSISSTASSGSSGATALAQADLGTSSGSTAGASSGTGTASSSGATGTSGTSGTSGSTGKAAGGTALAAATTGAPPRPKTFEGLMAEAAFWERKEKPQKAFAAYAGALELDPNSAEAWSGKGQALIDLERYPDAQAAFNHALGISPRFSDAEFGLAETYKYQGNKAAAVKQYKKFIDDHPTDDNAPVARNAIGQLSD